MGAVQKLDEDSSVTVSASELQQGKAPFRGVDADLTGACFKGSPIVHAGVIGNHVVRALASKLSFGGSWATSVEGSKGDLEGVNLAVSLLAATNSFHLTCQVPWTALLLTCQVRFSSL